MYLGMTESSLSVTYYYIRQLFLAHHQKALSTHIKENVTTFSWFASLKQNYQEDISEIKI